MSSCNLKPNSTKAAAVKQRRSGNYAGTLRHIFCSHQLMLTSLLSFPQCKGTMRVQNLSQKRRNYKAILLQYCLSPVWAQPSSLLSFSINSELFASTEPYDYSIVSFAATLETSFHLEHLSVITHWQMQFCVSKVRNQKGAYI